MSLLELFTALKVALELLKAVNGTISFFKQKYGDEWAEKMTEYIRDVQVAFQKLDQPGSTTEHKENAAVDVAKLMSRLRK